MSDQADNPKDPSPPASSTPAPRKKRSWKRRIVLTLLLFIAFTLILRASLGLILPTVLRKIAAGYDLDCTYERSELMLLSGNAGLWHLAFTPKEGGDPVLKLDYVRGNLSVLALLTGKLDVYRVEADGVKILVERTANGKIPLLEKVLAVQAALMPPNSPGAPVRPPSKTPINLAPPLKLGAFRLSQVQVAFIDRTLSPPLETTLWANVRVSDVQSDVRPVSFSVDLWADPLLDQLRIDGTARAAADEITASMRLQTHGLHPMPAAPYLRMLGIEPTAKTISLESTGNLTIKPVPATGDALQGALTLHKLAVRADGQDVALVETVQVDVQSVSGTAARIGQILVEGARLATSRSSKGNLRYAGFELAPGGSSGGTLALPNYDVYIAKTAFRKITASFDDLGITPPAALAWEIEELTANHLSTNLTSPRDAVDVTGKMSAPGISDSILLSGQFNPASETKSLSLTLTADAIKPDALRPYLDALGLQSELQNANFALDLKAEFRPQADGKIVADAQVARLRLTDGKDLMVMDNVRVGGLRIDLAEALLSIESIDIAGPSIQARRDATGRISVLGMQGNPIRQVSASEGNAAPPPTTAPTTAPSAFASISLPRIHVGKWNWKDIKVQFDDQMSDPPSVLAVSDAGVELNQLRLDLRSPSTQPGTVRAWMRAPGLVEQMEASGTLATGMNGLTSSLKVAASGISTAAAKPYLTGLGIEPNLKDGRLNLSTDLSITRTDDGLDASLDVRDLRYSDGETEIAGIDRFQMQGVSIRGGQLGIDTISITSPRAVVSRDAKGILEAGGIRLVGLVSGSPPPLVMPSTQPSTPLRIDLPIPIAVRMLDVKGAKLTWRDSATAQPVEVTTTISASMERLALGRSGATPATFTLELNAPGILGKANVTGEVLAAPDQQRFVVDISAEGLRAGPLAMYLPSGVEVALTDGRFRGQVTALLAPADGGGQRVEFSARSIGLTDGAASTPLLKVDSFELAASRIDPNSGVIAIDRVRSEGVEGDVRLSSAGALQLPGLRLKSPAPAETTPDPVEAPSLPAARPASAPTDVAILLANARKTLPLISVNTIDLRVARFSFHDDRRPTAVPLTFADLRLSNPSPIQIGGSNADERPPLQLELSTRLDPLISSVQVSTKATPLASEPAATVTVRLSGIKGDGITRLIPELSDWIEGTQLTDGQFRSSIDLTGKFARRGPAQIDFSRPFDVQFEVHQTEFRATPDGPVLLGVEAVAGEGIHVDPAAGVIVRSVEVTKPSGKVWRDDKGIRAAGIVVKLPTGSTTAPSTTLPAETPADTRTQAPTTRPSLELRIDRFLVSGIDFTAEDRTFDPPFVLPLDGLDVEVRSLSNLAMFEERPVRFNIVAGSGDAPLPNVREGQGDQIDARELFSQVTASGVVGFYPKPNGWAKASVNGFEMVSLRGVARKFGVTLGKGIFDTRVDLRLTGDGDTIVARTRTLITDLQITEPAGGPIQRAMALPGTLDAAITIMEDVDGSITLPVEVPIRRGKLSPGDLTGAAAGAAGTVVITAMANAPMKATAGVTSMIGLGTDPQAGDPIAPVELAFAPGSTTVEESQLQELSALIERMSKDQNLQIALRHELGSADLTRAGLRANPSESDAQHLAYQLHQRKLELLRERSLLAGQARAELASLPAASAQSTLERLRDLDTMIALTEDALDNAGNLLRPGADRQSARRTRGAALKLADDRLDQVHAYLLQRAVQYRIAPDRISMINPTATPTQQSDGGKIIITTISKKRQG